MKQLQDVLEGILDADLDVKDEDLGIILSQLTQITVYPAKSIHCTSTGVDFADRHLNEIKKAIQPKLPISSSMDQHLPPNFRSGQKYECLGQIICWVLSQTCDPSDLNDISIAKKFDKEVLTSYGRQKDGWLQVDWTWGDYYVHYSQNIKGQLHDFILMKFSIY